MPCTRGALALSAKWRRNKKTLKKFNIFRVFSKTKEKTAPRTFRIKNPQAKKPVKRIRYRIEKIPEGNLKEPPSLIDVLEDDNEISVVAEFAGFSKESLRISVKDQRLTLSARTSERKYRKSLNLPKRVIPDTACTTYKNGVLEIRLKKALEEETLDKIAG
jgi:HSP20 family molecular chaperone IbpA